MNTVVKTQTRTELHTHLVGMLSAEKFLEFLCEYSNHIYYPINEAYNPETCRIIHPKQLLGNLDAIEAISIPLGETRDYKKALDRIYNNRRSLMAFVIQCYAATHGIDEQEAQYIIYNRFFNLSMQELVSRGVQYAEISFSNIKIIRHLKLDDNLKDKIQFSFLMSTERTHNSSSYRNMANKLVSVYSEGYSIGFDIMGQEVPITDEELLETGEKSFYKKIKPLISKLVGYPDSVLRIHSGEVPGTEENSEKLFHIIEKIQGELKLGSFPPPELRIGHGVYYNETEYYYDFLKRNKAIVEINSTSNIALQNISNIVELPYWKYVCRGIPVVISTDGHGAYDTTTFIENENAFFNSKLLGHDFYTKILETDAEILERKTSK